METVKKYRVVWDQECCGNCHDEYLTGVLTAEEARNFAREWAEKKIRAAFPRLSGSENFFEEAVCAKMEELSYVPFTEEKKEPEVDVINVNLDEGVITAIKDYLATRIHQTEDMMEKGWGDRDVQEKSLKFNKNFLGVFETAKANNLDTFTLVIKRGK